MTTNPAAHAAQATDFVRLPDPPEPEDMTNNTFLHIPGNTHHLVEHFGNENTTIITGDAYISRVPTSNRLGLFYPDLLIAFNVDPEASSDRNGYIIKEQASLRTSFWKLPRPPPAAGTSPKSGMATPPWASRNTGALTTPGAGTTAPPWPGTGSLKACTSPSPSNGSTTVPIKATARSWTCTSAGRTPSSAGTTRPPDGTSPGSETSGTEPTVSTRPPRGRSPRRNGARSPPRGRSPG